MRSVSIKFVLTVCSILVISACGGGGENGSNQTAPLASSNAGNSSALPGTTGSGSGATSAPAATVNNPPVSVTAGNKISYTGEIVSFDGSGSYDPEGVSLTYNWTLLTKPAGSSASLTSTSTAKPAITPDQVGSYTVQLVVSDGISSSRASITSVTVEPPLETITRAQLRRCPQAQNSSDATFYTCMIGQLSGNQIFDTSKACRFRIARNGTMTLESVGFNSEVQSPYYFSFYTLSISNNFISINAESNLYPAISIRSFNTNLVVEQFFSGSMLGRLDVLGKNGSNVPAVSCRFTVL